MEICEEFGIKLPWPELLQEIKEVYVRKMREEKETGMEQSEEAIK